jgi:hypothetical protein
MLDDTIIQKEASQTAHGNDHLDQHLAAHQYTGKSQSRVENSLQCGIG